MISRIQILYIHKCINFSETFTKPSSKIMFQNKLHLLSMSAQSAINAQPINQEHVCAPPSIITVPKSIEQTQIVRLASLRTNLRGSSKTGPMIPHHLPDTSAPHQHQHQYYVMFVKLYIYYIYIYILYTFLYLSEPNECA